MTRPGTIDLAQRLQNDARRVIVRLCDGSTGLRGIRAARGAALENSQRRAAMPAYDE
jgi:hypothetical protein